MKKLFFIICCLLFLCACKEKKNVDITEINDFVYDDISQFNFDIHSKEYLLVRLSDFKVLYSKEADKKIYPASLTKIMTLDTVLNLIPNLDDVSSISQEQINLLIEENASIAYLEADYEYTIRELLYALILPSGADAAVALENYFINHGMNLVEEMNKQLKSIGCDDTNFVNTTGLHDDNHYTTLNDILKYTIDVLSYEEGRKILESFTYTTKDGILLFSTLLYIQNDCVEVLGGKTGFTDESGQSILVLYRAKNRSYILITANAPGDPSLDQYWHYQDAIEIMNNLY